MNERRSIETPHRHTIRVPFRIANVTEARVQRDVVRIGTDGEVRVDRDAEDLDVAQITGHASVFDYEYNVWGGPPYGWIERVNSAAFDVTLSEDPDVVFLRNHEGMPLARTKPGTLSLATDSVGLATDAEVDLRNPEAVALVSAIERGDVDEMSFAFRVMVQQWSAHPDWEDDEMSLRELMEINIHRGDVSAVTFGASDATDIDLVRSSVQRLDARQLQEVARSVDARLVALNSAENTPAVEATGDPSRPDPDLVAMLRPADNPLLSV